MTKQTKPNPLLQSLKRNQTVDLLFFEDYLIDNGGYLTWDIECHALFWYYLNARLTYEKFCKEEQIVYEGEQESNTNFPQLWKSIAQQYNIDPYKMCNYWDLVDRQCVLLGLPLLPDLDKYRFNHPLILT